MTIELLIGTIKNRSPFASATTATDTGWLEGQPQLARHALGHHEVS
jgi:hypothetical protein